MKKTAISFMLYILSYVAVFAQFSDENTNAINQYFSNIRENPVSILTQVNENLNVVGFQLEQNGLDNLIHVNNLQLGDKQVVRQVGNKNSYEYYTYYSVENSNISISQVGDSNTIQIYGENSLTRNATINQKSNFQELIIKNYSNSF